MFADSYDDNVNFFVKINLWMCYILSNDLIGDWRYTNNIA